MPTGPRMKVEVNVRIELLTGQVLVRVAADVLRVIKQMRNARDVGDVLEELLAVHQPVGFGVGRPQLRQIPPDGLATHLAELVLDVRIFEARKLLEQPPAIVRLQERVENEMWKRRRRGEAVFQLRPRVESARGDQLEPFSAFETRRLGSSHILLLRGVARLASPPSSRHDSLNLHGPPVRRQFLDPAVAFFLEFQCQVAVTTFDDPPFHEHMDPVRNDVVEKSLDVRKRIGYLPETVPLYTDMAVDSYLKFMGSIRGMSQRLIKRRVPEVIELCNPCMDLVVSFCSVCSLVKESTTVASSAILMSCLLLFLFYSFVFFCNPIC